MAKKKPLDDMTCENCGTSFTPNRYWQKYCTSRCRLAHFWVQEAQKIRTIDPLDAMMAEPPSGPTPGQEAERLRRRELTEEMNIKEYEQTREAQKEESLFVAHKAQVQVEAVEGRKLFEDLYAPKKQEP
jgi:hypothetical protein